MKYFRLGLLAVAAMCLYSISAASGVAGSWRGKLNIDISSMPKAANPQQQQMMEQGLATAKKLVFVLILNKNNTYSMKVQNLPAAAASSPNASDTGTWKLTGSTLTIVSGKTPPKGTAKKSQNLMLSKDGKTLTMKIPGQGKTAMVFARG